QGGAPMGERGRHPAALPRAGVAPGRGASALGGRPPHLHRRLGATESAPLRGRDPRRRGPCPDVARRADGPGSDRGGRALGRDRALGRSRHVMTRILVLPPPELWAEIVTPAAETRLATLGEVDRNVSDGNLPRPEVLERVEQADVVLTSWGAPVFD